MAADTCRRRTPAAPRSVGSVLRRQRGVLGIVLLSSFFSPPLPVYLHCLFTHFFQQLPDKGQQEERREREGLRPGALGSARGRRAAELRRPGRRDAGPRGGLRGKTAASGPSFTFRDDCAEEVGFCFGAPLLPDSTNPKRTSPPTAITIPNSGFRVEDVAKTYFFNTLVRICQNRLALRTFRFPIKIHFFDIMSKLFHIAEQIQSMQ